MISWKFGMRNSECGMKNRARVLVLAVLAALPFASGCRQKMADQPYYRPYEPSDSFGDGRSNRPLERGVIHRAQYLESDPLVTGLTRQEWDRIYKYNAEVKEAKEPKIDWKLTPDELNEANRKLAFGSPRYDQRNNYEKNKDGVWVKKSPLVVAEVYVEEFPFPITQTDLKRGQDRYSIFCAVCHGPLGNGQGKIWERGYLTPTSFHTRKVTPTEVDIKMPPGLGISRGYALWDPLRQNPDPMKMREVPVGYIFEVITKGFGGMPSYSAQIPPADRWKIIAYIRVLQLSQDASPVRGGGMLPPAVMTRIGGGKP
ncbi:MAG: cytochrome c [Planctomycetia bacterium]|nr:cytochrome c [Planctomycetia bacterium]